MLDLNQIKLLSLIYYISMQKNILELLIFISLVNCSLSYYCSSTCFDFKIGCFNHTPAGCMVCADTIYNLKINSSSTTPCTPLSQRTILANDLLNTPSMSLAGFTSSKTTPVTCTNYTFSGQYTNSDYLFKNYTGIGLNHYQVVIRFNIGYIGTWQTSDTLRLSAVDSSQAVNYDFGYDCSSGADFAIHDLVENINNQPIGVNSSDCVRIKEYVIPHTTSYLALNFTALTTQSDPNIQFWGIKEIIIATKDCHQNCLTCFGGLNSQCISCAANYYLQGNICLSACDSSLYTVTDTKTCVNQCPPKYYSYLNTTSKYCLNCESGCSICSDYNTCQAWDNQQAYVPNTWKDKMEFWIFLIIFLCCLIVLAIYKLVKKTQAKSQIEENMISKSDEKNSGEKNKEDQINESKVQPSQINNDSIADQLVPKVDVIGGDSLWFNELVELEPTQLKVRGRRKRATVEAIQIVNHFDAQSNVNL